MSYDPHLLDEIRERIRVSDVVGSRFQLRKNGSEFVVTDNQSFTVNDQKKIWKEFGNGGATKAGDIFDFVVQYEGLSFSAAVEELAHRAGIDIRERSDFSHRTGVEPARPREAHSNSNPGNAGSSDRSNRQAGKKEIVASWDYRDSENNLLYQVVRLQKKLPDGTFELNREGKVWKSFGQRRPSPDGDGTWIWGLSFEDRGQPIEFMRKGASSDWIRYDSERFENWHYSERKSFAGGNVQHWLYNANEVLDEMQEPRDDQRTIFLPEGEGKVDVLKEWGLLAITNSGGAQHFTPECAEFFRNAADVVILQDNDRAGAERVSKIAPILKEMGVRVRSLNFRDVWPECPIKGDVKDWRDNGGTKDVLLEIVDGLSDWVPEPYRSKYGARTWRDLSAKPNPYPWRIKGLVPRNDNTLIMGPSRSGKTFKALDMCMHVHFGDTFAGRKVEAGGIIYLTYEGATGFENRLRAYLKHHEIDQDKLHSFAWLTRPPGIFASEDNVVGLADEIIKIAEGFELPLAAIVIDTHNSATRGSSEVKSDDMTKIMDRYAMISDRTGAPLWIIGHTNADGKHRGNEQFFNNIETALLVERITEGPKNPTEKRDDEGHVIRRLRVSKQREDDDRSILEFVLKRVELGTDDDGDPIQSMVTSDPVRSEPVEEPVTDSKRERSVGFFLNRTETEIFKKLIKVLDEEGVNPPADLELPKSITRVARWLDLSREYRKGVPRNEGETPERYSNRVKSSGNRFKAILMNRDNPVIMVREATDTDGKLVHFVWPTGRPVRGYGFEWPRSVQRKESKPLLAPGETVDQLSSDVF